MTNVASDLHDLFELWRNRFAGKSPLVSPKQALRPETRQGLTEFVSAYRLLARADELIVRFEQVDARAKVYRDQFAEWARVPLLVGQVWTSGARPDAVVRNEVLNQIMSFSLFLEGKVLTNDSVGTPAFRTLIERANGALSEENDLPPHMVAYLRRLLAEIQIALDDEARGKGFDFHSAAQHLWAGLEAAAGMTKDKTFGAKIRNIADETLRGFMSGGGGAIGGSLVTLALTM